MCEGLGHVMGLWVGNVGEGTGASFGEGEGSVTGRAPEVWM